MGEETFAVHPENAWRALDGGVVVINATTTVYYSMNRAGAFIWHLLLDGGVGVDAITQQLTFHYGGDSADLNKQVVSFLEALEEEELIGRQAAAIGASGVATMEREARADPSEPYQAPRLDKYDSLEKLIVSGE
jgi:hypothetical protein